MNGAGSCIVGRDFSVLLERKHPGFDEARKQLLRFAELVKSPEYYHTYKMTPLSLWNAAAGGMTAEEIVNILHHLSKWKLPSGVVSDISMWVSRYGTLRFRSSDQETYLLWIECLSDDTSVLDQLEAEDSLSSFELKRVDKNHIEFPAIYRGGLKQQLARIGYPVLDEVGYHSGRSLQFELRSTTVTGRPLALRPYQLEGVKAFEGEQGFGGSGVLVLPCGAGKTVMGLAAMARFQCETLILTSNVTSVKQWISEIVDKTTLSVDEVGEYSGGQKQVRPVTVSTYQILTHRNKKEQEFKHMSLFNERDWGLIIYDEVHLLPAPVFRATADIQATRRLGLTATLIREDGCERDVFSLIGPKCYEVPWRNLEDSGYIAQVECHEIRVAMPSLLKDQYLQAEGRQKFRLAAENPRKIEMLYELIQRHAGRQILIIGQYLDQLKKAAKELNIPLITGSTPQEEREQRFLAFRKGEISALVVSKVANFAVDLPDASVLLQISGSFGSRQEEAQRLGRILRPKGDGNKAYFYTIVTENTREQDFAMKRQLFLIEQGYEYMIHLEQADRKNQYTIKNAGNAGYGGGF